LNRRLIQAGFIMALLLSSKICNLNFCGVFRIWVIVTLFDFDNPVSGFVWRRMGQEV
jgi:hypothetical protein